MNESKLLTHPARIRVASAERSQELFKMLQQRFGYDGDANSVYPFDGEISSNLLDSHFTRMSNKTLQNYAEDAQRGVAFLQGHNWRGTAIGYSLSGEYQTIDSKNRVLAGFYTVLGMQATDDLVKRIKSGLSRDLSVGFSGGTYTCDICGRDIWDWDCRHIPGIEYTEKRGDEEYKVISTFTIDDARLSEVSDVFDGSTPDAMILRAQRVAEAGQLTPQQVEILENRYRIVLPNKKTFPVGKEVEVIQGVEERTMDEKEFNRIKAVLVSTRTVNQEQAETLDDTNIATTVEELGRRFAVSEVQAEEGRQYRKDLVTAAIEEGVRAHGNDFDAESYRSILESAPLATIKRMTADWKRTADALLPANRTSTDTEQRVPVVNSVPDAAFA